MEHPGFRCALSGLRLLHAVLRSRLIVDIDAQDYPALNAAKKIYWNQCIAKCNKRYPMFPAALSCISPQ